MSHQTNVYPVFVGSAIGVTTALYSYTAESITTPFVSKYVIVYEFFVQLAVNVKSLSGIVAGISELHPANVYPVLLGSSGLEITVP